MNKCINKHFTLVIVAACAALLPLLFYPWDNQYYPRSIKALWDIGHVILFFIITSLFHYRWEWFRQYPLFKRLFIALFSAFLVGGAIEVLQYYLGRDASYHDLSLDILGALLAISCLSPAINFRLQCLRAISLGLLITAFIPAVSYLMDEHRAREAFPVLADFKHPVEVSRFSGNTGKVIREGQLDVFFTRDYYSGFSLKYFPRNWQNFRQLIIDIENPQKQSVKLTCRVHDKTHNHEYTDRFNKTYRIQSGKQSIILELADVQQAPEFRSMNMEAIASVGCFTTSLHFPRMLSITRIALKK